ncbi:MAG: DNA-directed RNA polymerase subunit omega [Armatimonadota bacterium]
MDKLENYGNKYALVTLAAKRAKQLKSGAPPLIETDSVNPLTIALEEIAAGKITCVVPEDDAELQRSLEPEVGQLFAVPDRTEDEEEDKAEAEAEEPVPVSSEATSDVEEEEVDEETDLEELEEEEDEEEEHVGWHPVLDEDLEDEEHALVPDDEPPVDIEPEIPAIAAPVLEDEEIKPKSRRGRKAHEDDIDFEIELDPEELDIDEEHEDLD